MRRFPAIVLSLVVVGLGCSEAQEVPAPESRPDAQRRAAEAWDRVFRGMPQGIPDTSGSFPSYCVDRAFRDGLLKQGHKALVIAMGDGRYAIPFAQKGLDVTGMDISPIAVERARKAAADAGVQLRALEADLFGYDYGDGQWDLVTNIYFNPAVRILDRIKTSVRPGGLLLIEGYGADHEGGGPPDWTRYKANQLIDALPGWRILEYQDGVFLSTWAGDKRIPVVRLLARKPAR